MNEKTYVSEDTLRHFKNTQRTVLELFNQGVDLRAVMSKSSFYRHRSKFLEFGIDIGATVQSNDEPNVTVVPFKRVLEAKPALIPAQFVSPSFYYQPKVVNL